MLEESWRRPNDRRVVSLFLSKMKEEKERERHERARPLGENASVESRACMREASGRLACARLGLERGSRGGSRERAEKRREGEGGGGGEEQHQQQHHHHHHQWRSEEGKVAAGRRARKEASGRTDKRTDSRGAANSPKACVPPPSVQLQLQLSRTEPRRSTRADGAVCLHVHKHTCDTQRVRSLSLSPFLSLWSKDRSTPTDIICATVRDDWVMSRTRLAVPITQ